MEEMGPYMERWISNGGRGLTWRDGSHLERWVPYGEIGPTCRDGSFHGEMGCAWRDG